MYFFIYCSEDGDVSVVKYDRDDLLKDIRNEYYGPIDFHTDLIERNPQYWNNKALIIKGEIVIPKPIEIVKDYEI